jgi:hypothetical protein
MPLGPFERALLPGIGLLKVFSGKTIDEARAVIRPHGYELISSDRRPPSGWPGRLYHKISDQVLLNRKWHILIIVQWYEKLAGRRWRRFYSFAIHKRLRHNESIPAFIYKRRLHRKRRTVEYVPIVYLAVNGDRLIVKAWKSWCMRARRSKSSGEDLRWSRGTRRQA